MPKSKKKSKPMTGAEAALYIKKDPLPPIWVPPPPAIGLQLLEAVEYKPLEEKHLYGLKISKRALKNLSPSEIRDLADVFQAFSRQYSGYLTAKELYYSLRALDFHVNEAICERYVQNEVDESTEIKGLNLNQFLDIIIDRQSDSKDYYEEIVNVFKLFDYDQSGTISIDKLRRACIECSMNFNDSDLRDMLKEADENGDGMVDLDEFIGVMLKTSLY